MGHDCTSPSKHWPSPRHGITVKQNVCLSLCSCHTLAVCIFKSSSFPPVSSSSLAHCHNLTCTSFHFSVISSLLPLPHLLLPDRFFSNKLSLLISSPCSLSNSPPFLLFQRQTLFSLLLSPSLCPTVSVIPLVSDLPGGPRHR